MKPARSSIVRCFEVDVNDKRISSAISDTLISFFFRKSIKIASLRLFAKIFNCLSVSTTFTPTLYAYSRELEYKGC